MEAEKNDHDGVNKWTPRSISIYLHVIIHETNFCLKLGDYEGSRTERVKSEKFMKTSS